jgi:class 3 adenylate cyclase
MDPAEQVEAMLDMERRGASLYGIYSSRPRTGARPSREDIELAFYPDTIYFYCSLREPTRPELRAFRIRDERVSELPLRVIGRNSAAVRASDESESGIPIGGRKLLIAENQMPERLRSIVEDQVKLYAGRQSVEVRDKIPPTTEIPLQDQTRWQKVAGVICVFVDMKGSAQLSANKHDRSTAGAYQLFTGTAVRLLEEFEPQYVDVRGDGVFALFNPGQEYRALAAAVSFKTFADVEFAPRIKEKTGIVTGAHIGIDQKTILVRKIGLKRYGGRTDRQNEVWAGKPVNMASKLAAMGDAGELLVSDRYYARITHEQARKSCGCAGGEPKGKKTDLWEEVDVSGDAKFDFDMAYRLRSHWCRTHGSEYLEALLRLRDG